MDIHVDIRGFLEIHAWICYGFSNQGYRAFKYTVQLLGKYFQWCRGVTENARISVSKILFLEKLDSSFHKICSF